MNIISYRGPGMAGGVSSTLACLWQEQLQSGAAWWHISGCSLNALNNKSLRQVGTLPEQVIQGHYRYCNEFLWPVMHDLPQFAVYKAEDHKAYVSFNRIVSRWIIGEHRYSGLEYDFIQDYQLALIPERLARSSGIGALVFWHIPWPRTVDSNHVPQLVQIARALLSAEMIGFHTNEYANNFMNFVNQYANESHVNFAEQLITRYRNKDVAPILHSATEEQEIFSTTSKTKDTGEHVAISRHQTKILVAPLGVDINYWQKSGSIPQLRLHSPEFSWLHQELPYVLSIDRADYTKGVLERFAAIDCFFEKNPHWLGKVVFAQICCRARLGLPAFDWYWNQCQIEAARLQAKWGTEHWKPLPWIDKPCSSDELAVLYRGASLMLVNPIRDGLNLTAKEFVACQRDGSSTGVLALSRGAGAWHELGSYALTSDPLDVASTADVILSGLTVSPAERNYRIRLMKKHLYQNALSGWWKKFDEVLSLLPDQGQAIPYPHEKNQHKVLRS